MGGNIQRALFLAMAGVLIILGILIVVLGGTRKAEKDVGLQWFSEATQTRMALQGRSLNPIFRTATENAYGVYAPMSTPIPVTLVAKGDDYQEAYDQFHVYMRVLLVADNIIGHIRNIAWRRIFIF